MGKTKDADKPRGKMSAYAYFLQVCREDVKKKHPHDQVNFAEFSKRCAEKWKTLNDKEKKRFHDMAATDKIRYESEMAKYVPPNDEKGGGKRKRSKKDPNAPKRALSAFFWFCQEERAKVKGANPSYTVGEVAKELGKRWATLPQDLKSKYEAQAAKDKQRYEIESKRFKAGGGSGGGAAPAAAKGGKAPAGGQAVSEEDDEDDDDDDEDDDDEDDE